MRNPNNQHFKHLQRLVLMYPRCYFQKQMPWARNLHQIPHEQVMVVEVEKHRQLSIWPHQPCCLTLERTTSNSFRSAVKDSNYLSKKKRNISREKYHDFCSNVLGQGALLNNSTLNKKFVLALNISGGFSLCLHSDWNHRQSRSFRIWTLMQKEIFVTT